MAARERVLGNTPHPLSCRTAAELGSQRISSGEREHWVRDDRVRCGLYWVTTTDLLNGSAARVVQPRTSEAYEWWDGLPGQTSLVL